MRLFVATLLSLCCACTAPGSVAWRSVGDSVDPPLRAVSGRQLRELVRGADADAVLVNVWATWCTSCREELPELLRLRQDYRQRGVAVVLLSGDFASERAAVLAALREHGVDFATYIKTGKDMELIEELQPEWSGALPASFVFARGGRMVEWWEGAADYARFAAALERSLAVDGGR